MSDIIIHIDDDISDYDALTAVRAVVKLGRQSRNGECYTFVCEMQSGAVVIADRKKADIFRVEKGVNFDKRKAAD